MSFSLYVTHINGLSEVVPDIKEMSTEFGLIRFDFEAGGSTWVPACNIFCISDMLPDGEGEE